MLDAVFGSAGSRTRRFAALRRQQVLHGPLSQRIASWYMNDEGGIPWVGIACMGLAPCIYGRVWLRDEMLAVRVPNRRTLRPTQVAAAQRIFR